MLSLLLGLHVDICYFSKWAGQDQLCSFDHFLYTSSEISCLHNKGYLFRHSVLREDTSNLPSIESPDNGLLLESLPANKALWQCLSFAPINIFTPWQLPNHWLCGRVVSPMYLTTFQTNYTHFAPDSIGWWAQIWTSYIPTLPSHLFCLYTYFA